MKTSLKAYSLSNLQRLKARVQAEITKRSETNKKTVLRQLEQVARQHGFDLATLIGAKRIGTGKKATRGGPKRPKKLSEAARPDKRRKVVPKYRHPDQKTLTWTGRGRKPRWVQEWLASSNGSLEQLVIK